MLSAYFMTQKYLSFSKITEMDPQTPGFLGWLINFTMSLCYIKHRMMDGMINHDHQKLTLWITSVLKK